MAIKALANRSNKTGTACHKSSRNRRIANATSKNLTPTSWVEALDPVHSVTMYVPI
jgi:hypothetical protein